MQHTPAAGLDISIVIPVFNEQQSILILHDEVSDVLRSWHKSYEIIYVDDGSTDDSLSVIRKLGSKDNHVLVIPFRANFGKSEALAAGFRKAQGDIIVTLDADLQDDPAEIPKLIKKLDEGYDLVSGWRVKRADTLNKKISSYLFNSITALFTGVRLHDANCGLKVLKREIASEVPLYGELHRFIPVLAAKDKFRVTEVPIRHRPRKFGVSKYGWERSWRGMVDLLTTVFLTDYSTKPAHFFGRIGILLFGIGFIMDGYVTFIKVTTGTTQNHIPMLLAGILFMVLGVQLLSTGLIAEMITHFFRRQRTQ